MGGSQVGGAFRWVERVGEQEERVDEAGLCGAKDRRLSSAVGMAAEEDAFCGLLLA